jgi:outer membrane lipoprotein carrier protein
MSKFLLLLVFCLPLSVLAKTDFSPTLLSIVDKYRAAALVTMKVDKTIKSELMDKETKYEGEISLSGEKFRLDTKTPEKALILFDGSTLWNVQYPSEDLGGSVQVLKSKINKTNRSQILLSALLDRKSLKKNFKVVKDEKTKLTIAPLTEDLTVKSIDLVLDADKKVLTEVSYKDDVGNLTTMNFSDIKFSKKQSKDLFKFKVPDGAQVTDL